MKRIVNPTETAISFRSKGASENNLVKADGSQFPEGFVRASIPGHPWEDTCWTRDCGVFLRELALWGYIDEACSIADYLIDHVLHNPEGFYSFPERFKGFEKVTCRGTHCASAYRWTANGRPYRFPMP